MRMSEISEGIFFDDVGSFPLPRGVRVRDLPVDQYLALVRSVIDMKLMAGVGVPTYPQFRDMIRMFMDGIEDPERFEAPYLIRREEARILELDAARPDELLRVCVTGPVELYISAFGATHYPDILMSIAESVARFFALARSEGKMTVASIDEPSLGLTSNIIFSEEEIREALEIASAPCRGLDCEVHLHSPLYAELCASVRGINIVGIESASHPDYLQLIDRAVLEETDSFLRAGIARTDILSISAGLNERLGTNLWDDMPRLESEILRVESADVMKRRLKRAHSMFGERLRATGPDCGLGSWPSQGLAMRILENCASALRDFERETGLF